jgi:hypothetical protein
MNDILRTNFDQQAAELDESVRRAVKLAGNAFFTRSGSIIANTFLQGELPAERSGLEGVRASLSKRW